MGGETANIAEMASKLSDELFPIFGWKSVGPTDQNWACVDANHSRKTHPSDVVFYYDEPYAAVRTYLNCDLKSYKKGSITGTSIKRAVENLAESVACAEKSEAWQKLYLHTGVTPVICGLLFIYNHDGEYDADFQSLLTDVSPSKLALPKGSKLVVLGPQDVYWLDNVRIDITQARGTNHLPPADRCQFFYTDLVRRKLIQMRSSAATIEVLTSPWIMLESMSDNGTRTGLDIYYRDRGDTTDEFMYLIDWLLTHQVLHDGVTIRIRTLNSDRAAASFFARAKQTYVENYALLTEPKAGGQNKAAELEKRLSAITCRAMGHTRSTFSDIEIGMRND